MKNREIELVILKIIEENSKFNVYPASDFKFNRNLKIPRVVSQTLNNAVISVLNEVLDLDDKYIGYKEINTHKHYIQLTFVLDKNVSYSDVEFIRQKLKHKVGTRYNFMKNGINAIIQKVGEIKDVSEHTAGTYLERYLIELEVNTVEEHTEKVEKIKKVKFDLENRRE